MWRVAGGLSGGFTTCDLLDAMKVESSSARRSAISSIVQFTCAWHVPCANAWHGYSSSVRIGENMRSSQGECDGIQGECDGSQGECDGSQGECDGSQGECDGSQDESRNSPAVRCSSR